MLKKTIIRLCGCVLLFSTSMNAMAYEGNAPEQPSGYEIDIESTNGDDITTVDNFDEELFVEPSDNESDIIYDANARYKFYIIRKDMPFVDNTSNRWFYSDVKKAYQYGLMNGTSATTFSPDENCSRAMVVQILYNMAGRPEVTLDNRFNDVPSNRWYAKAIAWASQNGIASGNSSGQFMPDAIIVKQDICTMIYNYGKLMKIKAHNAGIDIGTFRDIGTADSYAIVPILWCADHYICNGVLLSVDGRGGYYIRPKANVTRAEVAKMVYWLAMSEDDRLPDYRPFN